MSKLNQKTKDDIRDYLRFSITNNVDTESKIILLHIWVCGLLENVDLHKKVFFEEGT